MNCDISDFSHSNAFDQIVNSSTNGTYKVRCKKCHSEFLPYVLREYRVCFEAQAQINSY